MLLDVYKIIPNTAVEGPENRFCIWVQGCKKHCKGCWATDTWAFDVGKKYSVESLYEQILEQKDNIEGVTFLGGEPFEQAKALSELAEKVKANGFSVVCFTGYLLEELKAKNDVFVEALLSNIDLLIDGGFEQDKFDLSRPWVGSSNQRYYFLTDFYTPKILQKYKNKIEARISKDGRLELNGMGDFGKVSKDLCLQVEKYRVK